MFRVVFRYVSLDGATRTAVCHVPGDTSGTEPTLRASLLVGYPHDHPEMGRIVGSRIRPFPAYYVVSLATIPIGVILLFVGIRSGLRKAQLLSGGALTTARLVNKRSTFFNHPKFHVWAMTFVYESEDRLSNRFVVRTARPEPLEDDADEPLLYEPTRLDKTLLLHSLFGNVSLDPEGNFRPLSLWQVIRVMFFPGITLALGVWAIVGLIT